jgi:glycosyltransferase involved in cell wall biosynthesis
MKVALLTSDTREVVKAYEAPKPSFGTAPTALLEGFKMLPGEIEVHVISCLQKAPISSQEKLADNIYYHALHVPNIGWMKTGYLGCSRAVRRKLRKIEPDIVHGQGTERDCAHSAVLSGYPNLVTIHGVMGSLHQTFGGKFFSYHRLAGALEAYAIRKTDGVICISSFVEQFVAPLARRTWSIPNAIRSLFFQEPSSAGRRAGPARLLNVGVIYPLKQQVELLRELLKLREHVDFEVTFVGALRGDTPYGALFTQLLANANALHGEFRHIENVDETELLRLFDDSDALLHFSKEESFGLVFAEAQARGLELFVSDVGAIKEISRGNPECHTSNSLDLTAAHDWIQSGGYLRPKNFKLAKVLSEKFSPRRVAANHLDAYRSTLEDNPTGRTA